MAVPRSRETDNRARTKLREGSWLFGPAFLSSFTSSPLSAQPPPVSTSAWLARTIHAALSSTCSPIFAI
jgi:hypothetical protein